MSTLLHSLNTRDSGFYGHDDIFSADDAIRAFENGEYDFVATIGTEDLDQIYIATQNIEESWVESFKREAGDGDYLAHDYDKGCRSTMVGDIILSGSSIYIVARCGFDRIGLVTDERVQKNMDNNRARA